MKSPLHVPWVAFVYATAAISAAGEEQSAVVLPQGVKAVWDLDKAYRDTTPTRERICINGLWQWQPAEENADQPPSGNWGYFKVPGCWPGATDYMQKDCQTVFAHPSWRESHSRGISTAWYQREITVPKDWNGRRISLSVECLNSYAVVFVDGNKMGEMRFPAGEVELSPLCRPGGKYRLSMLVVAMPLKAVMLSFSDTNAAKEVRGAVARRGLCGDVYLSGTPSPSRITDVRVDTSVRNWQVTFHAGLQGLLPNAQYSLRAEVTDNGHKVGEFTSRPLKAGDLRDGHVTFTEKWKPPKLWDTISPQKQYQVALSLLDAAAKVVDTGLPVRFGFREFWIDGRDFYLNGSRIFLCITPLDNAQVSAAEATYQSAKETMLRLQSFGVNCVYTHNYGCEPGSHLSFTEILSAADDVGMLVSLSQPHFGQYDWAAPDADRNNGYARDAAFYVGLAGSHPSVVFYSMSHNATGYVEQMNPEMIDGVVDPREDWAKNSVKRPLRAEAIVHRMDPTRIVYHHSSGNLSAMHTANFYPNFVPVQEMSEWFGHWATQGVKPLLLCEFAAPYTWDFAMYRGWYRGGRAFGSAVVPWELCLAEWNSQFFGDRAFRISELEKRCLRWEAEKFRTSGGWHRWDFPVPMGSREFEEQFPVIGMYIRDNWRAFRTYGVSAINPWEHEIFWKPRPGVDRSRKELKVDWEGLQRPGFSPDYSDRPDESMAMAFERSDWIPTPAALALLRNNMPLLAYIGGKAAAFTSKDHNFTAGETVQKQLIVINNSRKTVTADCHWSFGLPKAITGAKKVTIATGDQKRIPLLFALPATLAAGRYELSVTVSFTNGETQTDSFTVNVLPRPTAPWVAAKIAVFDPKGETTKLLTGMGIQPQPVEAGEDLARYDILVVGKGALTAHSPGPDVTRVREGLKVLMFEQTSEVLQQRFGFRVAEYGLRQVFKRVPDHPVLAGLDPENLRDWRGEATIVPPRLKYELSPRYQRTTPTITWAGIEVPQIWRCGNRGNVASVLIEKPTKGDFLPIIDGGYSLQYSPLMQYCEGKGMVLFCQMDVTGRGENDPAAETLTRNLVRYVSDWKPAARRKALYVGEPAGRRHLEFSGIPVASYDGGELTPDQVLVVGPGGGQQLAVHAAAVGAFVKAGGNLLALGLDQRDANAFLPFKVRMTKAEHIASLFEPPGANSLLAGVGPADVHNRVPRKLPLVTGGATVMGDGALAKVDSASVVFFQLAPYTLTRAEGAVPSFVIDNADAVDGKRSALLTLGTATQGGMQFGQQLAKGGEPGKTYTFAVFVKSLGVSAALRLEIERPVRPWDRAVKGPDVLLKENEWTELHVTFKVQKRFDEGWFCYVSGGGDGARLRLDLFRIYEGGYVPWEGPAHGAAVAGAAGAPLFTDGSFETKTGKWYFSYSEQYNARRSYRRWSFALARLLANMGVAAPTPLLARFSSPVTNTGAEKRWLDALYVDQPEDWDYPYRFFCW